MKSFGTWYMDPPFIFNVKTQTDIHVSFIYPLICILEKINRMKEISCHHA